MSELKWRRDDIAIRVGSWAELGPEIIERIEEIYGVWFEGMQEGDLYMDFPSYMFHTMGISRKGAVEKSVAPCCGTNILYGAKHHCMCNEEPSGSVVGTEFRLAGHHLHVISAAWEGNRISKLYVKNVEKAPLVELKPGDTACSARGPLGKVVSVEGRLAIFVESMDTVYYIKDTSGCRRFNEGDGDGGRQCK